MNIKEHKPLEAIASLAEMEFKTLAAFNSGHIGVFWSEPGGPGPWELHSNSDELLYILEGKVEIEVLPEQGPGAITSLSSGGFMVVPQGHWHRHYIVEKAKELYLSPDHTQHSNHPDPR